MKCDTNVKSGLLSTQRSQYSISYRINKVNSQYTALKLRREHTYFLWRLFLDNAKKLTGQPKNAVYQAFDRKKSQRTAPQNLGHELLQASFFQVVIFIHSFVYILFLFIGNPYCSFPLIMAMYSAWQINTILSNVRGAKIWEQIKNSWRQKGNLTQALY